MTKKYQTQWAGQFGVAHELTRRDYLVTFTTGNAPAVDLLCQSPAGVAFSVQVKSSRTKAEFLYGSSVVKPNPSLCFVFVHLPAPPSQPEYFVLNNAQFLHEHEEYRGLLKKKEEERGKIYAPYSLGIRYDIVARFRDAWYNLPQ